MAHSPQIEPYRPEYSDAVLALHEAAMRAEGAYVEGVPDPDLQDVSDSYGDGEFLLGLRDGDLVAMGAFRPATGYITEMIDVEDRTAELKRMRVDPAHQREGYGQAIYDDLEQRARDRGFDEIVLDTMPVLDGAVAFYRRNGFEQVGRETVEAGGESFELLLYRKFIADD